MNVLVTGVNGGIGSEIAKKFTENGDTVYGIDKHPNCNHKYCKSYSSIDFTHPDWSQLWVDRIDVLINNAAIQVVSPFMKLTNIEVIESFQVNVFAVFDLVRLINFSNNANIINIGSIHSTQSKKNFSLYATTKGALETLTRSLSIELAPNIRVNMIKPAAIETPMLKAGLSDVGYDELKKYHPTNSIGSGENIAYLCISIINNSFMNGSIIELDGGISNKLNDPEQ